MSAAAEAEAVAVLDQAAGKAWAAWQADCVEWVRGLPAASIDLSVYSPPFSSLYIYSDSERDMGNCGGDEDFFAHYAFLLGELRRATRPGRLSAVHVKDLVYYQNQRGTAGLRDFSGGVIAAHLAAGWDYHSRITIWRDPVREMQKTKAHGLLYKSFREDASICRSGLPEYLLLFRRWPGEGEDALVRPVQHDRAAWPLETWQDLASPVWMDCRETDVLNVAVAREDRDEKHLCPMPLDITRRAIWLYSNPGETICSPFMGIGSEGVVALEEGRRFLGCELKEAYYRLACRHLDEAERIAANGSLLAAAT